MIDTDLKSVFLGSKCSWWPAKQHLFIILGDGNEADTCAWLMTKVARMLNDWEPDQLITQAKKTGFFGLPPPGSLNGPWEAGFI